MALERSAHLLRLFGAHADGDGLIGAANDLAAATADLLEPEPLLRLTVLPLLIEMLASTRADVRLAACVALRTACRFEAVQQECAVLGAAPPLTKALSTGPAEVQLEACKAAEAIARHDAGREALAEAGAVRLLLRLARDELHPAQEHAAAALAHAVRLDASGKPPSSTKVVAGPLKNKGKASAGAAAKAASAKVKGSGKGAPPSSSAATAADAAEPAAAAAAAEAASAAEAAAADAVAAAGREALDSFVVMAQRGGAVSREQASHGLRHLCRSSEARQRLVRAGAVEALLSCGMHHKATVTRAATAALEALTAEAAAARRVAHTHLPAAYILDLFRELDTDGDGEITRQEFLKAAPALGIHLDIKRVFDDWSGGDGTISGDELIRDVSGLAVLTTLTRHADGATRLAAQRAYAHLCRVPENAAPLLREGALGTLLAPLRDEEAAESQQAAAQALGALCTNAALTRAVVTRHGLLGVLLEAARGKQRRLGRRAALALKADALAALAALAQHPALHDYLIEGGLAQELLLIAPSTPHIDALRPLLLALLRLLRTPHSSSRLQITRTPHALETLRGLFRAKALGERVRALAALALAFIAADPQCHLPCGQPPREHWQALAQREAAGATSSSLNLHLAPPTTPTTAAVIAAVAAATAAIVSASATCAIASATASASAPGGAAAAPSGSHAATSLGRPPLAEVPGAANASAGAPVQPTSDVPISAGAVAFGAGPDGAVPVSEGDFLAGLVGALGQRELAPLALTALSRLALKWEMHGCLFDAGATSLVVRIARHGLAAVLAAVQESDTAAAAAAAAATDGREAEARREAASVLKHLNAARELRLAARHALPLPRGAMPAIDAIDIASLASSLTAASVDTVAVAVCGLANLAGAHATNRDKLAARHCVSPLLALAQSEIGPVQRDALRTLSALALHVATKEELLHEGALPLLLNLFGASLHAPPASARLRALQDAHRLGTRRLAACALANLSEGHLRVQQALVEHPNTLRLLLAPLQRHHAALSAAAQRAADGPPKTAQQEAAYAVAEAAEAGAHIDARSRAHLLRCLANLSLNDANHGALLESALVPELPPTVRRGGRSERRSCALVLARLAPNAISHPLLTNPDVLSTMIRLIEAPDAPDAAADEDDAAMQVEVAASGGRGEGGGVSEGGGAKQGAEHGGKEGDDALQASAHAHATTFPHAHAASAAENGDATRFAIEAESALWEPGGAVVEGEEHTLSARQLALQSLAELSADETTHLALVRAGIVETLLPIAATPTSAPSSSGAIATGGGAGTGGCYGPLSEEERMEAISALANLAENPEVHELAFAGTTGTRAFELFVSLIQAPTPQEQREGFRALSSLAFARSRAAATTGGGAIEPELMELLLRKAEAALEPQADGRATDEEVAFHTARALSLLSSNEANRRLIVQHRGLPIMYALCRQADTDVQAEAATVLANVTAASWEAQLRVCSDGVVQLLLYLCSSTHHEVRAAAARAVANLTQNIDNEPALRAARCHVALFACLDSGSEDVRWQCKRALANLEAARLLAGLRKYGGSTVIVVPAGEVAAICKHADVANVGSQREVARALANLAAAAPNHPRLLDEGGMALCMDLVISNSPEVQQQATRALGNLALAQDDAVPDRLVDEGALELLVLLAASWDEGVQQEAAIALTHFAERPRYRLAVVQAGVLSPLLEQIKSANASVRYHAALCLMAVQ